MTADETRGPTRARTARGPADLGARVAKLTQLLELHAELTDPVRSGRGFGAGGLPLMPHAEGCAVGRTNPPRCSCWRRDVVELERLLALMRARGRQEAYGGWPLSTLRFHVLAWYVGAVRVGRWVPIEIRKGRKLQLPTGQDVLRTRSGKVVPARYHVSWIRQPDARRDRAELGVRWMAERWSLGHEPMLPDERVERGVAA